MMPTALLSPTYPTIPHMARPQCSSRFLALRAAQPSLTICWARPTARAPGGTSLVMVEPAPM